MDSNQAFDQPVTTLPQTSAHPAAQSHQTPPPNNASAPAGKPAKRGRGPAAPKLASTAKSVTLTFSSPEELAIHDQIAKAAADDDRSVNQFIVRVLMGKETMPKVAPSDYFKKLQEQQEDTRK
jgi:hypothetical protein